MRAQKTLSQLVMMAGILALCGCSQNGSGTDSSSSSTVAATSVLSTGFTPGSPGIGDTVTLTVSGGTAPYSYGLLAGSGVLNTNIYSGSNQVETAQIRVTDAVGNTTIVYISVSSTSATTTTTASTATTTANSTSTGFSMYAAPIGNLTYYQPSCGSGNLYSDACSSGIHRQCTALGFVSGFGPQEFDGTNVTFTCVPAASGVVTSVSFATLQTYVSGCSSATAFSDACLTAVHRFCAASGYVSGTNIVEHSDTDATVNCINAASGANTATTFSALAGYQSSCTSDDVMSGACFAAYKRSCQAMGYTSGYGAVEHYQDDGVMICVK